MILVLRRIAHRASWYNKNHSQIRTFEPLTLVNYQLLMILFSLLCKNMPCISIEQSLNCPRVKTSIRRHLMSMLFRLELVYCRQTIIRNNRTIFHIKAINVQNKLQPESGFHENVVFRKSSNIAVQLFNRSIWYRANNIMSNMPELKNFISIR